MQYGKKMQECKITSSKNEKIKKIIKLKDKNKREKYSLFLIEGYREILRATEANIEIESLFICPSLFLKDNETKLIDKIRSNKTSIFDCVEDVFRKISYRDRPDGLLAIAKPFNTDIENIKTILENKKNPFLIILESLEKPGNLGTILRTADASGADAVIVADPMTDIFNPNVVRSSIGTLFTVPIFVSDSRTVLKFLKEKRIEIIAATPSSDLLYTSVNLNKPIALAFGTEQLGLSKIWMENSDVFVKIPMFGKADSLNVAVATTILLYETLRQRKLS
jgi:RNA methyltransferase, TrmH family